eukprot:g13963.t1
MAAVAIDMGGNPSPSATTASNIKNSSTKLLSGATQADADEMEKEAARCGDTLIAVWRFGDETSQNIESFCRRAACISGTLFAVYLCALAGCIVLIQFVIFDDDSLPPKIVCHVLVSGGLFAVTMAFGVRCAAALKDATAARNCRTYALGKQNFYIARHWCLASASSDPMNDLTQGHKDTTYVRCALADLYGSVVVQDGKTSGQNVEDKRKSLTKRHDHEEPHFHPVTKKPVVYFAVAGGGTTTGTSTKRSTEVAEELLYSGSRLLIDTDKVPGAWYYHFAEMLWPFVLRFEMGPSHSLRAPHGMHRLKKVGLARSVLPTTLRESVLPGQFLRGLEESKLHAKKEAVTRNDELFHFDNDFADVRAILNELAMPEPVAMMVDNPSEAAEMITAAVVENSGGFKTAQDLETKLRRQIEDAVVEKENGPRGSTARKYFTWLGMQNKDGAPLGTHV